MKYLLSCFLIVLNVYAVSCKANDSVGSVGQGGIEYKRTNEISMEKEVLTISEDKVRVEYEFVNNTNHPIKETIVFPMAALQPGCDKFKRGYDVESQDFKLWVDGQEVKTSRTFRAELANGSNVTERLRKLGLSDSRIINYGGYSYCEEEAPPMDQSEEAEFKKLKKEGLIENRYIPLWRTSYVQYWDQEFPAQKKVNIVHEYSPVVGGGYFYKGIAKLYCQETNSNFFKSPTRYKTVAYVLRTGANWAGPIKDFTLNVVKGDVNDVVSLCFDGQFKRKDELTFSSHLTNFLPKEDISVIFFTHTSN